MASSMPPPPLPAPFRLEVHIVADEASKAMFVAPRLRFFHNTTPTTTIDDFCDSVQKWYSKTYGSALMVKKCQAGNGADVGAEYKIYEMFDRSGDVIRLIEQPLPGREDSLFPESTLRPTYTRKRPVDNDNQEGPSKRQMLNRADQPMRSVESEDEETFVPSPAPPTHTKSKSKAKTASSSIEPTSARGGYPACPSKGSKWTPEQDKLLVESHANGLCWAEIVEQHLPTFTTEAIRSRHARVLEFRRQVDRKSEGPPQSSSASQRSRTPRSPIRLVKRKVSTTAMIPHNGTAVVGGSRRSVAFAKEVIETPSKPRKKKSITPKSAIKNTAQMRSISREVSEALEDLLGSPARSPAAFMAQGPATSNNDIEFEPSSPERPSLSSSPPPLPESLNAKVHTDEEDHVTGEEDREEEEDDWVTEAGSERNEVESATPTTSQFLPLRLSPSPTPEVDQPQQTQIRCQTPPVVAASSQSQRARLSSTQTREIRPMGSKYITLAMLREAQAERENALAAAEEKEAREEEARKQKQPSPEVSSSSESSSSSDDDSDSGENERKSKRVRTKPRRVISFSDIKRKITRAKKQN